MGKIRQLDDGLSNRIAAGEVVERPASVVKELAENSIDAGSTVIEIEVEEAGLAKIRITDNGDGIMEEDVPTAFYRHATSKIKDENDLFRIRTLGFRGEALPSIASVSRLEMKTSTGMDAGNRIMIEGGTVSSFEKADSRKGTDITITDLFYNTPARLKYMKTVHTELGNITDVVNRLALAHPEVAFRLVHNGRKLLQTNGSGDVRQVLAAIYGMNIVRKMVPVTAESLDFSISGWITLPELTRASRNYITTMVNGRFIKNYPLVRAIQEGCHTLLPIGRFPVSMMDIKMDPILVDVNVHPAKLEVRLSKEQELTRLVSESVAAAFKTRELIPAGFTAKAREKERTEQAYLELDHAEGDAVPMPVPPPPYRHVPGTGGEAVITRYEHSTPPGRPEVESTRHDETARGDMTQYNDFSGNAWSTADQIESSSAFEVEEVRETGQDHFDTEKAIQESSSDAGTSRLPGEVADSIPSRVPALYPIGQMHGTYILAQNERGLYLIDQHAAQERIKYEYFRERVGMVADELQELLVPLTFEYSADECLKIEEYTHELEKVGVFLEPFGHNAFIVRSHPQWLPRGEEKELIEEMIEQLLAMKKVDIHKLREEAAIMMSCKASIKANRHLRNDEIQALLDELRSSSDPFTCPHGRPIIVHYSTYELEKMFKRVM
ncbi:DNA mismatch repair endonuclease MutL [Mesobacillus zeae]|uniref:DNA mismatch repair protein MutL n=1 Tax=Mesobacillus zeae TaxID=1917180 RepID=A0A398BER1_9BACI|nr:DNA mismatch repair endonuclease MutL [Mesobacillus zeae]RID88084.1 DNA mismatch repair endonuclease MutL [Mesobacillus zeae]